MAIKKRPVSPRQKMINLMYVVLMAMLALNVSSEVLDGFSVIEDSILNTTENTTKENAALYKRFKELADANPAKAGAWYRKALLMQSRSDSLFHMAESLKVAIAIEADGKDADPRNLKNKEDLEAAAQVMLSPTSKAGRWFKTSVEEYRTSLMSFLKDSSKRDAIAENFSTESKDGKDWLERMFGDMPAAAAVTFLSKFQSDIRYAEGEVLHSLLEKVDEKDVRVNALNAFVIPNAQTIVQGNRFSANIVMASIDTTQVPNIYIGGEKVSLKDGIYEVICNRTGDFTLDGYIELAGAGGDIIRRDFSQKYSVVEPTATVSADLMNVLYAGYDNPVSVSVPGVPLSKITATMSGGTLIQKEPGKYVAKPTKIGQDAVITVFSTASGTQQQMAEYSFKVRKLPEPSPYITLKDEKGGADRYRGGNIAKNKLLEAEKIGAAIDDGILDVPFRVISFETVFFDTRGNAVPMVSEGDAFSSRQKEAFKRLSRSRRFYISRITAIGPDGIERKLSTSMEVIVK